MGSPRLTLRRAAGWALVGCGVLAVLVALLVLVRPGGEAVPPGTPAAWAASTAEAEALGVLADWDRERTAAYATGSAGRLRALYQPGAAAGVADLRVLRAWHRRGLRVTEMRTQVLALVVLDSSPGRLRLRVTDRLAHAVARGGGSPMALPHDRASTRVVTLVRGLDGRWRVAAVRDASGTR